MLRKDSDSIGVSPVIGAMLLLMTVVLFISWYQIAQVPAINQDFESDTNDEVISSMINLKSSQLSVLVQNETIDTTTINNVVSYPLQPIKPRDSIGTIRFKEIDEPYEFSNLDDSEYINNLPNDTIHISYKSRYLELTNRNYSLENGILVDNQTESKYIVNNNQIRIQNTRIYLYDLESEIDGINTRNPELTILSDSKSRKKISQSDLTDDTKPLVFKFKSNVSATKWTNILKPSTSDIIQSVSKNNGYIVLELNNDYEYTVIKGKGRIQA